MRERGIVEENLSVEKEKKRKEKSNSPFCLRRKRRIAFVSLFLREVDVFSFFFWKEKVLSPQKVRETFGRRTAHFGRTHALR